MHACRCVKLRDELEHVAFAMALRAHDEDNGDDMATK